MVGSFCCPRDSQESSPTPQLESMNCLVLSLLYGYQMAGLTCKLFSWLPNPQLATPPRSKLPNPEWVVNTRRSLNPSQLAEKQNPQILLYSPCSFFLFLVTKVVGTSVFSLLLLLLLSSCLIHVLMSRFGASCCNEL